MKLMFVGDVNLGEYYTSFGHGPRTYLASHDLLQEVAPIFSRAVCVVGNLEAVLSNHNLISTEPESMVLRGNPEGARLLAKHGFKIMQVANNHVIQHGYEAFKETLSTLRGHGIEAVGLLGQNPVVIEREKLKIGFLAASDVPDNTDKGQAVYQPLNEDFIRRCQQTVSEVDHLFVLLHWGLEASTSCLPYQRELIERLRCSGVRGVVGNHPHLFYEVWRQGDFVAAPSLGNFVFDLCWDERLVKTGILEVDLSDNILNACVWPVEIRDSGCVPTPAGESIDLTTQEIRLYDLGRDMNGEQWRKLRYFFRNLKRGNRRLKIRFLIQKMSGTIFRVLRLQ